MHNASSYDTVRITARWRSRRYLTPCEGGRGDHSMAMGRQTDRQGDLIVTWSEMPRSPGHVFYDRLQQILLEAGFDSFVETTCKPFYAATMGARSVPPGRYFRMHMVGYFEILWAGG